MPPTLDVCEHGLWEVKFAYQHGSEKMRIFQGHGVYVQGDSGTELGILDLSSDTCVGQSGGMSLRPGDRVVHNAQYCKAGLERSHAEHSQASQ